MEFFEVVQKRKAVRSYRPGKKIPDGDIEKILQTVSLAPSAKNLQSYKIFIASSQEIIDKIYHGCYNQHSNFIKSASLILVFCTDPEVAIDTFSKRGKMYSLQDATIAAIFAQLAATALGYQSCWVGNFREEEIKNIVKTGFDPIALIIIGFGSENPPRKERKKIKDLAKII